MNTQYLSSSGLTRGSSLLHAWMPDQVGHDIFQVLGHDSFETVGHDTFQVVGRAYLPVIPAKAGIHVSVIPAHAGIHAFKTWMPDQVGHDRFVVVGHDIHRVGA